MGYNRLPRGTGLPDHLNQGRNGRYIPAGGIHVQDEGGHILITHVLGHPAGNRCRTVGVAGIIFGHDAAKRDDHYLLAVFACSGSSAFSGFGRRVCKHQFRQWFPLQGLTVKEGFDHRHEGAGVLNEPAPASEVERQLEGITGFFGHLY